MDVLLAVIGGICAGVGVTLLGYRAGLRRGRRVAESRHVETIEVRVDGAEAACEALRAIVAEAERTRAAIERTTAAGGLLTARGAQA